MKKILFLLVLFSFWVQAQPENGREIEADITADFPPGQRIDPEEITLNGKNVYDHFFPPGNYTLEIRQWGYFPLKEEIVLPQGEGPFRIERTLLCKPRPSQERIYYDAEPTPSLPRYEIWISPLRDPGKKRRVKEGDRVKPDVYLVRVTQEAYLPTEFRQEVGPGENQVPLEARLISKEVSLQYEIVYDVEPPVNLDPCTINILEKKSGIPPRGKTSFETIKPGSYWVEISRPGYDPGPRESLEIVPQEKPHPVRKILVAKPRAIALNVLDRLHPFNLFLHKVSLNGEPFPEAQKFKPGVRLEFSVQFRKHKTVRKSFLVIAGEGEMKVALENPMPLKRYHFSSPDNTIELDGLLYPYELHADGEKIEDHLVEVSPEAGNVYYAIWVDPTSIYLYVYGGYLFVKKAFIHLEWQGMGSFQSLSIPRLIAHLEKKSQSIQKHRNALDILEKMVSKPYLRVMLRHASDEIVRLKEYVRSWEELTGQEEAMRINQLLEELERMRK